MEVTGKVAARELDLREQCDYLRTIPIRKSKTMDY